MTSSPKQPALLLPVSLLVGALGVLSCVTEQDALLEEDLHSEALALTTRTLATVAAGYEHSCAVSADGTVQCWGRGTYGRLGNGSTAHSSVPVDVVGIDDAVEVTTGAYHSCALLESGRVSCWGYNAYGQLGDGSKSQRTTPVTVVGVEGALSVSAGSYHTCASTALGQVKCWGYNGFGELGNESTTSATTARTVGATVSYWGWTYFQPEGDIAEVDAGAFFTCARKTYGAVRCWGRNDAGQLGNGTTTSRTTPGSVTAIASATAITAGDRHACAAAADGTMWCWGSNSYGQLGDNSKTNRTTPVQTIIAEWAPYRIPLEGVQTISAGVSHTCASTDMDVQWCTGRNQYGQHGRGTSTADTMLMQGTSIRAVETSAGMHHTCARTLTGAVQCAGRDNYGQLGGVGDCALTSSAVVDNVTSTLSTPGIHEYSNGGVHYLVGDGADVGLIVSECATIDRVVLNGLEIGTAPGPDGGSRYYEVLTQTPLADGTRRIVLRIHYPNGENGTSFPLEVSVTGVSDSATVETMLVGVMAVSPINTKRGGLIHFSQDELRNAAITSLYELYGDHNYYDRSHYPDFYDFDYDGFSFYLDSEGIVFSASTKARVTGDIPSCDPTVSVNGRFKVVWNEEDNASETEWVDGPHIDTRFPTLCNVVVLDTTSLADLAIDLTKSIKVQRRLDRVIKNLCDGSLACTVGVNVVNHLPGAVEVVVNPIIAAVSIRHAYDTDAIADYDGLGELMDRGMAIPANQAVVFSVAETVQVCQTTSADCTANTVTVSGSGVFNRDVNPPVPSPWPTCDSPPCPYFDGRQGPWEALRGARRDPALLPLPNHNVATLVARTYGRTSGGVFPGPVVNAGVYMCFVPKVEHDEVKLVLGRNDYSATFGGWDTDYGTGEAIVTIGFPKDSLTGALDACEQ